MAQQRLKLSRNQLTAFLNDFESIKQFELLFSEVDNTSSIGMDGVYLESSASFVASTEALDSIDRVDELAYPIAVAPPIEQASLETLTDVKSVGSSNRSIIQYNSTTGKWESSDIVVGLKYGGTSVNYTEFEADGTLKMNGDATVWNDWNLSRDFTPTTGAGVPARNALIGNIVKDQFAVNDALQYMSSELLHDWKEGSDLQVHVHWATGGLNDATVRGVKWEIEYTVCNPLESSVAPTAYTATLTQSNEFSIPAAQPDRTHRVSTIYTIPGSTLKIGAQLLMRLKRIASVTNPAPANDPFVISFGVHFEADTLGSRTVMSK
jgi:hypothetical protein